MRPLKWRKSRRQKERDDDLDLLATMVAKDFALQLVGARGAYRVLAIVRAEKSVDALIDEIDWTEIDDAKRERLEQFVAQIRSERETNPGFLTLSSNIMSAGIDEDICQELSNRVLALLKELGVQSIVTAEREDGMLWFIGTFCH